MRTSEFEREVEAARWEFKQEVEASGGNSGRNSKQ
jgi:hypothetical protein